MIPNFNEERRIPYGVISGNSVPDLVNDIFLSGTNLSYNQWCEDVRNEIRSRLSPYELSEWGSDRDERWDYMVDVLDSLGFSNPREDGELMDLFDQLEDGFPVENDVAEYCINWIHHEGDEDRYALRQDGVSLELGWLGGATLIWVLDSNYVTWARTCSPCVPGAGDLDSPTDKDSGFPCLSLPPSWYEDRKHRIVEVLDHV